MAYKAGPLYPCNPATARSESTKLGVDPKGERLIYTNGRAVIHTSLAHAYTQHTQIATVARFSPSGYYCASADVAGNVRIWDVTQPDNNLKLGIRPLSGKISDLAWDGESKRIIVGGEGKDKFGAAFFMDSGSSCGEIVGHAKPINALSVRHQRPFRAVSGSDDNSLILHTAVPFKYDKMINTHNRFVRDVAFSPNGELFASVASDGKLFFYDGKSGEVKGEVDRGSASSSLMACSWTPDSAAIATAGADGIVSIWDASTLKSTQSWTVGSDISSQQNGVVFANANTLVSISLSGVLNLFDTRESTSTKWRTLHGATKAITASSISPTQGGEEGATFYAGSFDGTIKRFDLGESFGEKEGTCTEVEGTGHTGQIAGITSDGKGKVWSAGWDDKVSSIEGQAFGSSSLPTKAQPAGVAATSNAVYVATSSGLEVHPVSSNNTSYIVKDPTTAVAAHPGPNSDTIAYGVGKKVIVATTSPDKTLFEVEDNKGDVLSLAFSSDGKYLAAGDAAGRIILIDVEKQETTVSSRWTFHTGRVVALAWSSDGKRLASAGLDEVIYIWSREKVAKNVAIKNAHPGGVSGVSWLGDEKIITTGADGCVRNWTVPV
ncbi:WD-repeat protein [Kwoniella heveanensis CBS 569]|nr:WD-repeat protein [Kwoniella heveanensis CBS 569]